MAKKRCRYLRKRLEKPNKTSNKSNLIKTLKKNLRIFANAK